MFNPEFYPTPTKVIEIMIEPFKTVKKTRRGEDYEVYSIEDRTLLEPSAGKGDIVDYITGQTMLETGYRCKRIIREEDVICIEKDINLRHILSEKGYSVVESDIFNFGRDYYVDLILMNPPFSNGDKHLLKAWDILTRGDLVCILNAETIRNPYSESRTKVLDLIQKHGRYEFYQNMFSDAERETDVEIAIVWLTKESKTVFDFTPGNSSRERNFEIKEEMINNVPETLDVVGNMILQFDKAKMLFANFLKAEAELNYYLNPLIKFYGEKDALKEILKSLSGSSEKRYNQFCNKVRGSMWLKVMGKLGIERYMTKDIRDNFARFSKNQANMQFTKENVSEILQLILHNSGAILEKALVDVFDKLTEYHEYNRYPQERWKTNSAWKVNQKLIFPYGVEFDMSWYNQGNSVHFYPGRNEVYDDLDRVMAYISGRKYEDVVTIREAMSNKFNAIKGIRKGDTYDNTLESTFFEIKFWKKGTVHLKFKDEFLWQEFNMRACAMKKWLPWEEEKEWRDKTGTDPVPEIKMLA